MNDTDMPVSVVCSICGGARVTCTAVVGPDTEAFAEFGFDAFCDGPCADCASVVLTDPDGVCRESGRRYAAFRAAACLLSAAVLRELPCGRSPASGPELSRALRRAISAGCLRHGDTE